MLKMAKMNVGLPQGSSLGRYQFLLMILNWQASFETILFTHNTYLITSEKILFIWNAT